MITIHHLDTSRSERIVWLAEELGIEYRIEPWQRQPNGAAPEALRAVHPLGKAPIIRDGDTVLAGSGGIVEYRVNRHADGRLAVQPSAPEYARYLYWMHFAEGSLMTLMIVALVLSRMPDGRTSSAGTRVQTRLQNMLAFVDGELAARPWFAGAKFTAADVMMTFAFTTMRYFLEYDLSPYPHSLAYLARVEARPAYRKAMELAGPKVGAA
jgi:glutathione S-transferase